MFEKLVSILPRIRTVFGLVGLVVAIGGYAATRQVAPDSVPAQVAAGAVGVNLIIFGQVFYFLRLIPAAQRAPLILRLFVVFCVLTLLLLATAIYAAAVQRFRVVSAAIQGAGSAATTTPTTADDLEVTWAYTGQPGELDINVVKVPGSTKVGPFHVSASDRSVLLPAGRLRALWPKPTLQEQYRIRVEFQSKTHLDQFGPFDVAVGLVITFFYVEGRLTVASMTEPQHQLPHEFSAKCVGWPASDSSGTKPDSIEIAAHGGVGHGSFPSGFVPEVQTIRCAYLGNYPPSLVRYRNLNVE